MDIRSRIIGHGDEAPDQLLANPLNFRRHPPAQRNALRGSLKELGWIKTVLVNQRTGNVIDGHARVEEALSAGLPSIPVTYVDLSEEEERLALAVLDPLSEMAVADDAALAGLLAEVNTTDAGLRALLDEMAVAPHAAPAGAGQPYGPATPEQMGALAARFGAPPFSVLDTRQGYWTLRKSEWKQLTGDLTETKENVLAGPGSMLASVNGGSSNFDPVLAELMYRWFCPPRGKILDPFGGEQTKGVVAGALGYTYRGVEFRPEQVAVNERACARFPSVAYRCGDSEGIEALVEERDFDLLLTSPPYYDLEVYSAADMSAMPSYADFLAKYQRIFEACARMLRPDGAFVVVKVGEIRDKDSGEYRDFVGDTVATLKAAGLHYYNEAVLINNPGTAPLRAAQSFRSRKLVKLHQNVLVFWSGDLSAITARFEGLDNEGVALPGEADPL